MDHSVRFECGWEYFQSKTLVNSVYVPGPGGARRVLNRVNRKMLFPECRLVGLSMCCGNGGVRVAGKTMPCRRGLGAENTRKLMSRQERESVIGKGRELLVRVKSVTVKPQSE